LDIYLFSFTEPLVVVSVGAPSFLPMACESVVAAVCELSLAVPNWFDLPIIICESAVPSFGWLLLWHAPRPAHKQMPKISFFIFLVILVAYLNNVLGAMFVVSCCKKWQQGF
jgi:hypothetical protein